MLKLASPLVSCQRNMDCRLSLLCLTDMPIMRADRRKRSNTSHGM